MNNTCPVSVVIPHYSNPKMLLKGVKSALRQELPPAEIIVVDDASKPGSEETLANIEKLGCKVIRLTTNHFTGGARNIGVEAATQPYIAFLDHDDFFLPLHLTQAMQAINSRPHVMYCERVYVLDIRESLQGLFVSPEPEGDLDKLMTHLPYPELVVSSWVLPRSDYIKVGKMRTDNSITDFELFYRLFNSGVKVVRGNSPQVCYIWNSQSVSSQTDYQNESHLKFLELWETVLATSALSEEEQEQVSAWIESAKNGVVPPRVPLIPIQLDEVSPSDQKLILESDS